MQDTNNKGFNPNFDDSIFNGVTQKSIVDEANKHKEAFEESKGLFMVKTGNRWMEQAKNRPIPKTLFGKLWFENELCILFADTNLGKSILAVQIADSISKGESIPGLFVKWRESVPVYGAKMYHI